jgi:uncharacterized protein (TIGR02246 family)
MRTSVPAMRAEALVDTYFSALNSEDWPTFVALWAPDGVFQTVGARPRRGGDEIAAFLKRLFTLWTTHDDRPVHVLVAPDQSSASVEILFSGTTASGVAVSFEAVDLFDFVDGRVTRVRSFYDLERTRELIAAGEAPAAAAN